MKSSAILSKKASGDYAGMEKQQIYSDGLKMDPRKGLTFFYVVSSLVNDILTEGYFADSLKAGNRRIKSAFSLKSI
jgi:hypothetical protein